MLQRIALNVVLAAMACLSCSGTDAGEENFPAYETGYDFSRPGLTLVLPDTLREISGLAVIDSTTAACIQDENGILFIYDFGANRIARQYPFHLDGDYEGIARRGKTIFILRSDGVIFEIPDYEKPGGLQSFVTGIPAANNEGLCLDTANNRLLIACKSKAGRGPSAKTMRPVYAFDLATHKLSADPVFNFDVEKIIAFANRRNIALPVKKKKNGQEVIDLKFRTSAIALHPVTGKLFLLSAVDHMLFIFDTNGTILHIELLDPVIYNKAEGISFLDNGDILITNEGKDKKPTLLRLNYRQQ
jgi:hypothetical protein